MTGNMGYETLSKGQTTCYAIGVALLVVFSGITAGLQVALFSIDRMFLRILTRTGTPTEQKQSQRLLGVLQSGHWTLVALLVVNASVMMGLPILLERLFDELTALLLSITVVLFFGDIIPLSLFVRHTLFFCSFFVPFVWFALVITSPVSYPLGKLLDVILGHKKELLHRDELAALIVVEPENDEQTLLRKSEISMVKGALQLSSHRLVNHIVTTEGKIFMLSSQTPIDKETINMILLSGYSRIPVFLNNDRRHILGVLIVYSLIKLSFSNLTKPLLVGEYPLSEVIRLSENTTLYSSYLAFHESYSNMAIVYDNRGVMMGLWTLTDLLETLYSAIPQEAVQNQRQELMVSLMENQKCQSAMECMPHLKPSLSNSPSRETFVE